MNALRIGRYGTITEGQPHGMAALYLLEAIEINWKTVRLGASGNEHFCPVGTDVGSDLSCACFPSTST